MSESEALCWRVPAVAVMVTIEVTGGGVEPLPPIPLPPHPETNPTPVKASNSSMNCSRRCLLRPKKHRAVASAVTGKKGRDLGRKAEDCALAEMLSWVFAAVPEGVTVVGLKEHVAPTGSPEHAKLTAVLNPYCGVTVRVTIPCPPD